jgi:protein-disulfide isomerase/uncharacterized membrane protein
MRKGRWTLFALLALNLLGLASAAYLTWLYYLGFYMVDGDVHLCTFGTLFNCYWVLASRWAEIVPGWPLSTVVAGYFTVQLLWGVTEGPRPVRGRPDLPLLLNGVGCLVGAAGIAVMVLSIEALCPLCLTIDLMLALTFLLRWRGREEGEVRTSAGRLALLGLGALAILVVPRSVAHAHARTLMGKDVADILAQAPSPDFPRAKAGPLTLVAFLDFGCPFCRRGSLTLKDLQARHPGRVRLDVRNYPLNPKCNSAIPKSMQASEHRWSCEAAAVALAAQELGRFEEAYSALYGHQEELEAEVARWTKDPAIAARLAAGGPERRLAEDVALGQKVKLEGVPTYYLDGLRVDGPRHPEEWEALLAGLERR